MNARKCVHAQKPYPVRYSRMGSRKKSHEDKMPSGKKSHVGKYPKRIKSHKEKSHKEIFHCFGFFGIYSYIAIFKYEKFTNFLLLHIHSLHTIFVSLSLSDKELALACVLYSYEAPRTIVPNLYNWIG